MPLATLRGAEVLVHIFLGASLRIKLSEIQLAPKFVVRKLDRLTRIRCAHARAYFLEEWVIHDTCYHQVWTFAEARDAVKAAS